jgi:hypothetical protein
MGEAQTTADALRAIGAIGAVYNAALWEAETTPMVPGSEAFEVRAHLRTCRQTILRLWGLVDGRADLERCLQAVQRGEL